MADPKRREAEGMEGTELGLDGDQRGEMGSGDNGKVIGGELGREAGGGRLEDGSRRGVGLGGRGRSEQEEEVFGEFLGPQPDLEDQFAGMRLHGEEEQDLDFSEEVEDLVKDVRWLALFRVHTTKPFSHGAL